jgi:peptidoglycan hydrolase CwlO-like protein
MTNIMTGTMTVRGLPLHGIKQIGCTKATITTTIGTGNTGHMEQQDTSNRQDHHGQPPPTHNIKVPTQNQKVRRSIKKKQRKLTQFYSNARGLKSKINSLKDVVEELQPQIMLITETNLKAKESIKINNYKCIEKHRINRDGGGV